MSFSFADFGLVAISLCVPTLLIAPSPTFFFPVSTYVSCLWVFLSFSFFFALPWVPLSSSFGYLLVDLFFLFSLSGFPLTLPLPCMTSSSCTIVFPFLCMHLIFQISFYCGFYCILSTYFLVTCLVEFFVVETKVPPTIVHSSSAGILCSICRVPCCFCRTFRGAQIGDIFHIKLVSLFSSFLGTQMSTISLGHTSIFCKFRQISITNCLLLNIKLLMEFYLSFNSCCFM